MGRDLDTHQLRMQEKLGHVKGRLLREDGLMIKKSKVAGGGIVLTLLDAQGEQQPMHTMNLRVLSIVDGA